MIMSLSQDDTTRSPGPPDPVTIDETDSIIIIMQSQEESTLSNRFRDHEAVAKFSDGVLEGPVSEHEDPNECYSYWGQNQKVKESDEGRTGCDQNVSCTSEGVKDIPNNEAEISSFDSDVFSIPCKDEQANDPAFNATHKIRYPKQLSLRLVLILDSADKN
jgi:hypothetical protein